MTKQKKQNSLSELDVQPVNLPKIVNNTKTDIRSFSIKYALNSWLEILFSHN